MNRIGSEVRVQVFQAMRRSGCRRVEPSRSDARSCAWPEGDTTGLQGFELERVRTLVSSTLRGGWALEKRTEPWDPVAMMAESFT